jgi:hypothetical protein
MTTQTMNWMTPRDLLALANRKPKPDPYDASEAVAEIRRRNANSTMEYTLALGLTQKEHEVLRDARLLRELRCERRSVSRLHPEDLPAFDAALRARGIQVGQGALLAAERAERTLWESLGKQTN